MMTHGPPMGVLDATYRGENVGCEHLLRAARRCRPRLHCFGHIHEGWGAQKVRWSNSEELDIKPGEHVEEADAVLVDSEAAMEERAASVDISQGADTAVEFGKETLMVNASIMTIQYKPWNAPWLVDMDLDRAE
jgi:Icc-related predicted phosphoesterase